MCRLYFDNTLLDLQNSSQPAAITKYWTNDVKSAARCKLLRRWRQNDVKSASRCGLLNRWPRKPGDKDVLFWWAEKQRAKWQNSSVKNGKMFWLDNKAIIVFGFRRIWRILQIKEGVIRRGRRPRGITPCEICRILHIVQKPNSIIANYSTDHGNLVPIHIIILRWQTKRDTLLSHNKHFLAS